MALSRKRCIGEMIGQDLETASAEGRLAGTLAANMISVQKGAKIIRVHDVSQAIDTLNVMKNLR
jgi:dihydropteroate synthase